MSKNTIYHGLSLVFRFIFCRLICSSFRFSPRLQHPSMKFLPSYEIDHEVILLSYTGDNDLNLQIVIGMSCIPLSWWRVIKSNYNSFSDHMLAQTNSRNSTSTKDVFLNFHCVPRDLQMENLLNKIRFLMNKRKFTWKLILIYLTRMLAGNLLVQA